MKKNSVNMLSGSAMRGLLSLTIPIMIMNVAQSLFNLIDVAILRLVGYESATGAVGAVFAKDFLIMTNCDDSLLGDASKYFRIYFYGLPIQLLYNFCASILRALGDAKRPMYFLFIGGVCKIGFTALFLSIFKRGVESVGIATVIANLLSCALSLVTLLKNKDVVR